MTETNTHAHTHTQEFAVSQVGQLLPLPHSPIRKPSGEAARNIIAINQGRSPQGYLLFNYQAAFL